MTSEEVVRSHLDRDTADIKFWMDAIVVVEKQVDSFEKTAKELGYIANLTHVGVIRFLRDKPPMKRANINIRVCSFRCQIVTRCVCAESAHEDDMRTAQSGYIDVDISPLGGGYLNTYNELELVCNVKKVDNEFEIHSSGSRRLVKRVCQSKFVHAVDLTFKAVY